MCSDNCGETGEPDGVCECCGEPTVGGISTEICNYSPENCEECHNAPCDGSC